MDPAIASTTAATTAAQQQEQMICWYLFKHQLKLTTGLLQSTYRRNRNVLLAPNQIVSSLATLVPGQATQPRIQLAKSLFWDKCNGKMSANQMIGSYCLYNKHNIKQAAKGGAYKINNTHYSHPSQPIKPKLAKKLWKKYRTTGKELEFVGGEKANLQALSTINGDVEATHPGVFSPMLTPLDYVSLMEPSVRTVLSSTAHFSGLWSKSFEVQYGEFRRSDGSSVKTPLLVKSKSYLYYYDKLTGAKVVRINGSHQSQLALVLILPDEATSTGHFIEHLLDYAALKRMFRKTHTRTDVHLTFPKFALTSSQSLAKPMQTLALAEILHLKDKSNLKTLNQQYVLPVDENVILLSKSKIEVKEDGVDIKDRAKAPNLFGRSEVDFTADRPFLFALVTNGQAQQVLMFGVCEDPTRET